MAHLDLQRGTHAAALELLRGRDSRRIGHNTTLRAAPGGGLAVRYYSTDIYRMTADGWAVMYTGGWSTVTTWSRINALLPGPFGVYSRRDSRMLYAHGFPVTPYTDGLAVNDDTGAVGYAGKDGAIGVILSADDVAGIVAAGRAAADVRAANRAARLVREHPAPRTFSPDLPALSTSWSPPPYAPIASYGHRGRLPDGCISCRAESASWRELRRGRLALEHANGWSDGVTLVPAHTSKYGSLAPYDWRWSDCPVCHPERLATS